MPLTQHFGWSLFKVLGDWKLKCTPRFNKRYVQLTLMHTGTAADGHAQFTLTHVCPAGGKIKVTDYTITEDFQFNPEGHVWVNSEKVLQDQSEDDFTTNICP